MYPEATHGCARRTKIYRTATRPLRAVPSPRMARRPIASAWMASPFRSFQERFRESKRCPCSPSAAAPRSVKMFAPVSGSTVRPTLAAEEGEHGKIGPDPKRNGYTDTLSSEYRTPDANVAVPGRANVAYLHDESSKWSTLDVSFPSWSKEMRHSAQFEIPSKPSSAFLDKSRSVGNWPPFSEAWASSFAANIENTTPWPLRLSVDIVCWLRMLLSYRT